MSARLHQHYLLPTRLVHVVVLVLSLSLLVNLIGIAMQICYTSKSSFNKTDDDFVKLPITPRPVALEVVDSDRYGMLDDNDWASVTPLGHGFVKVGEDDFFAISMYHQMHCLNNFRKIFIGHRNASRAEHDALHELHCLTYLRQMVLCSADTTLEPAFFAQNTDGRKTQAAYGTGVTHQCRDWVQVRQFAEDNYAVWKDDAEGFAASELSAVNA